MQTTIAADKSGKSQLKRMAGASPAVILVMLHVKFPLRPSRGGHKQLSEAVSARVRYKMFSRSAGAFRTGTCYTQVSITNRMSAASIRNK